MDLAKALDRLTELTSLPEGWDSYGGKKITAVTAGRVYAMLKDLSHLPDPHILPRSNGGILVEWDSLWMKNSPYQKVDTIMGVDVNPAGHPSGYDAEVAFNPQCSDAQAVQILKIVAAVTPPGQEPVSIWSHDEATQGP